MWLKPRTGADLAARNRLHEAWAAPHLGTFRPFARSRRGLDHPAWPAIRQTFDIHNDGYAENLRRYYESARESDPYRHLCYRSAGWRQKRRRGRGAKAGISPSRKWGAAAGLQVVGENDKGILVSGFKILATGAILADEILFGNFQALAEGQEKFAATFSLKDGQPRRHAYFAPAVRAIGHQRNRRSAGVPV